MSVVSLLPHESLAGRRDGSHRVLTSLHLMLFRVSFVHCSFDCTSAKVFHCLSRIFPLYRQVLMPFSILLPSPCKVVALFRHLLLLWFKRLVVLRLVLHGTSSFCSFYVYRRRRVAVSDCLHGSCQFAPFESLPISWCFSWSRFCLASSYVSRLLVRVWISCLETLNEMLPLIGSS